MKKIAITIMLLSVLFFTLVFISEREIVKAEPEIVVPDDYPTISAALVDAREGDTVFVKKGHYQETTLEINKSISLVGEDVEETILTLDPPLVEVWIFYSKMIVADTAITINTTDFKLSGFTLNMPSGLVAEGDRLELVGNIIGSSVQVNGALLNITNNEIASSLIVNGSNQTVANNSIEGRLDSSGSFNRIIENTIRDDIDFKGSSNWIIGNSFSRMNMESSNSNLISGNSFTTLWIDGCSNNTISANKATGPANWGILMGAGSYNVFHDNLISNYTGSHGYGIAIGGNHLVAEYNTFYRNMLMNNDGSHVGTNWEVLGAGNFWDNGEVGNYWDTYTGTDSDEDGIGDVPYIVEGCKWDDEARGHVEHVFGQDNYPLMEPFQIPEAIPEFPSWIILPLSLITVLFVAILKKRVCYRSAT
jgi:nitrous oxidase accessory protein